MVVRREAAVAVDDHQVQATGRVGEESAEAGNGPAGGLVDVGGDVMPARLAGHLGYESGDLALQCVPAASGCLSGVDRSAPHGSSFGWAVTARRPLLASGCKS